MTILYLTSMCSGMRYDMSSHEVNAVWNYADGKIRSQLVLYAKEFRYKIAMT